MYIICAFGVGLWAKFYMKRGFAVWALLGTYLTPMVPLIILLIKGKKLP